MVVTGVNLPTSSHGDSFSHPSYACDKACYVQADRGHVYKCVHTHTVPGTALKHCHHHYDTFHRLQGEGANLTLTQAGLELMMLPPASVYQVWDDWYVPQSLGHSAVTY